MEPEATVGSFQCESCLETYLRKHRRQFIRKFLLGCNLPGLFGRFFWHVRRNTNPHPSSLIMLQDLGRLPQQTPEWRRSAITKGEAVRGGETAGDQDGKQDQQQSPSDECLVVGLSCFEMPLWHVNLLLNLGPQVPVLEVSKASRFFRIKKNKNRHRALAVEALFHINFGRKSF